VRKTTVTRAVRCEMKSTAFNEASCL
jgi:hypothetical protein